MGATLAVWATLGHFGPLWATLAVWATLGHFGCFGHFGPLWATLGHFGCLGHFGHVNSCNVVRYPLDRNGRPEQHVVEETAHSPKWMVFAGPWDGNVFGYSVFGNRNMNGVMYNLLLTQRVLPELKA